MLSAPIKEPWLPTDEEEEMLEGLLAREESWDASRKSKMQWNVGLDPGKTGEPRHLVRWGCAAPTCPTGACCPSAAARCSSALGVSALGGVTSCFEAVPLPACVAAPLMPDCTRSVRAASPGPLRAQPHEVSMVSDVSSVGADPWAA